jgi:Ca2+-binding RTX toxin-like protein
MRKTSVLLVAAVGLATPLGVAVAANGRVSDTCPQGTANVDSCQIAPRDADGVTQVGTAGDDLQRGSNGDDVQRGGVGNDTQIGLGGNDAQHGGSGNDSQYGNDGDDIEQGGPGNDLQNGGVGDDTQKGGAGNDVQYGGTGRDTMDGGAGADTQTGGNGDDVITGGSGSDIINGDGGSPAGLAHAGASKGHPGNDTIYARDGQKDHINCGGGRKDRVFADKIDRLRGCEKVIGGTWRK